MLDAVLSMNPVPIIVGMLAGAVVLVLGWRLKPAAPSGQVLGKGIEQDFRTVFGLMMPERREALLQHYMQKHRCSRREAMKIAIEHRQADEERW